MPGLVNRGTGYAISVGGSLEPVEPVYTKPNTGNAINSANAVPSAPTTWKAPVVHRGQDTRGMRYLWADQTVPIPLSSVGIPGSEIGNTVWSSAFQAFQGSLRDYGFYDLLYRAGYPGFNLALSFRVPVNPSVGQGGVGQNNVMKPRPFNLRLQVLRRATGTANMRG